MKQITVGHVDIPITLVGQADPAALSLHEKLFQLVARRAIEISYSVARKKCW